MYFVIIMIVIIIGVLDMGITPVMYALMKLMLMMMMVITTMMMMIMSTMKIIINVTTMIKLMMMIVGLMVIMVMMLVVCFSARYIPKRFRLQRLAPVLWAAGPWRLVI